MTIAYLVNQYPRTSHSFIRREIVALESLGVTVHRFALRPHEPNLPDPADRQERTRTRAVQEAGIPALFAALLARAVLSPGRFTAALWLALRLGWRGERGPIVHLAYLAEACLLLRWLRQCEAQHLHAHFGTNSTTVAMLIRALGGPSFSCTVHGPEEFDKPAAIALGEKLRRCAFAVAVSHYGRGQLLRWCDAAEWPKIHVVHCGVDAEFLGGAPTQVPDVPRLVCVGRLCEAKGQTILLDAVAELVRQGIDLELVLAGDGPLRGSLEAHSASLGLGDKVRFAGQISGAQVREEMTGARAMVLASFAEGLPVVVMEALALGRPVVATYVGGVPELVEDGVCGYVVPAGDAPRLAAAMAKILRLGIGQLTEMGRQGALRVARDHDARHEAARLAELFAHTVSQASEISPSQPRARGA